MNVQGFDFYFKDVKDTFLYPMAERDLEYFVNSGHDILSTVGRLVFVSSPF